MSLAPGIGDDAAGQDGEAALPRLGHVANHPVHDEGRHTAPLGDGAHVAAGDRVVHVAGLDDDDVARGRPVDRRVHHEIVAGSAADGVGGTGDRGIPGQRGRMPMSITRSRVSASAMLVGESWANSAARDMRPPVGRRDR